MHDSPKALHKSTAKSIVDNDIRKLLSSPFNKTIVIAQYHEAMLLRLLYEAQTECNLRKTAT